MADLKIVKPERLSREDVISEICNGNRNVANLISRSGMTRGVVRGIIRDLEAKGKVPPKIRHPRGQAPKGPHTPARVIQPQELVSRVHAYLVSLAMIVVALALGIGGIALNYQYSSSLGQNWYASQVLGIFGIAFDVVTIFVPTIAFGLWERGSYGRLAMALGVGVLCASFSIMSALSFAAVNVGDSLQDRDSKVYHRKALDAEIAGIQAEMGRIGNVEDPQVIEEKIQIARGQIPVKNLTSSRDCADVTASGPVCAELNRLRGLKRASERRNELDARLVRANDEIAALPPVSVRDPGAAYLSRLTFGLIGAEQVEIFRVVGFACISSLAGVILMFARMR